ncbi:MULTISPECIES: hypothetical protein [Bacillus]|uniref:hypothetical protein n=1 Tax=Bacillus TaxID=1386 RepID=UPI001238C04E|nr:MULTISPECIES: hypothetical protein [Bacillus]KAA6474133.1 hypothetical protein DX928_16050 [Bacillus swezeyi]MCY8027258.1 hypothetical protein [Bacillus sonorensis]
MKFYGMRNGKINVDDLNISFTKFRNFFLDIYSFFEERGDFKLAFYGYKSRPRLMKPSPETFLFTHVGNVDVFPIEENYYKFNKVTIFTLIEILHKYIWKIDELDDFDMIDIYPDTKSTAQKEFREEINKYLIHLDDGYILTEKGYIIDRPDDGLGHLITIDLPPQTSDTVTEQVETAIKMFFKFDSNLEEKRKAINILADILEPYREKLKSYTTEKHDKMIFSIVNNYGIRHNNLNQKEDYEKPVWYQWMFHYYLSTVHAVLSLTKDHFK